MGQLVRDELAQRRASGYDVAGLLDDVDALAAVDPEHLLEVLERTQRVAGWMYDEPSDPAQIMARLPAAPELPVLNPVRIRSAIHGGWLGRCVGCMMGKPVEGWTRNEVREHLQRSGAYPLRDYVPPPADSADHVPRMKPSWPVATRGRIRGVARDDDIDYTILGLHLLEAHGRELGATQVAEELVDHLPFMQVFTAERVAYANIVAGLRPPATASHRNPYREWIGALIRADIFGFTAPGQPREAASRASRDASVSHTENGLYASMWAAALIALSCGAMDPGTAVVESLRHVPPRTRLHEAISSVLEDFDAGRDWEAAADRVDAHYGDYHWVHAIPNAAMIAAAVLWSQGDFVAGVGLAVMSGRDTDSVAATVGSVLGAFVGVEGIPAHLSAPLEDRVGSALAGFDGSSISTLAERTVDLARSFRPELTNDGVGS